MVNVGVNSLPLISVISIFTGAVASWQAAYQFQGIISKGMSMSFLGAAVSAAVKAEAHATMQESVRSDIQSTVGKKVKEEVRGDVRRNAVAGIL